MKICVNPNIGNMILSYELGQLSEAETEQFEQHLFECAYCADEVFEAQRFVEVFKTAIHENRAITAVTDFAQLKTYSRDQLNRLREGLQATLDTLRQLPTKTVVYADVEGAETQEYVEAIIKNTQGNTIGQTKVQLIEKPEIAHGIFTTELEIPDDRYIGCDISVGIKLSPEGLIVATEYENIPADGVVLIREEMDLGGDMTLRPEMLVVTIIVP